MSIANWNTMIKVRNCEYFIEKILIICENNNNSVAFHMAKEYKLLESITVVFCTVNP